jgi:shikimate dehydrogenase
MRKFGLIGYPLGHSFSGNYFREKFSREHINGSVYSNFEISEISALPGLLEDRELEGLNVTIPYKQSVIAYLDSVDRIVQETGACNCIRIQQGRLSGYNTDVIGFEKSLEEKLRKTDERALILGTGGSSRAVAWVLQKKGIRFQWVSREKKAGSHYLDYNDLNREILETHSLIVNSTPLGMYPKTDAFPPIPYEWIGEGHYLFDLIYNPAQTLFLQKGHAAGARIKNGADMLALQAEASWLLWNTVSGE